MDEKHAASEFITIAFELLSKGWVFSAIGALVMLAVLGTYFKTREGQLLDKIASLQAMLTKDLDESRNELEKKAIAIKVDMSNELASQRSKHEKDKAFLITKHNKKQEKMQKELDALRGDRQESLDQVRQIQLQLEAESQARKEEVLALKKEMEDRLETQRNEIEQEKAAVIEEQADTISELEKKVAALETALLHW